VNIVKQNFDRTQLRRIEEFGCRIQKFGFNFALCGADGQILMFYEGGNFSSPREQLTLLACTVLGETCRIQDNKNHGTIVSRAGESGRILAVALGRCESSDKISRPAAAAIIDVGDCSPAHKSEISAETGLKTSMQDAGDIFAEMLRLLAENIQVQTKAEEQIEEIGTELSRVYEELVLLHKISTNMKVTEPDSSFLQMACDSLTELVCVEGIAIILDKVIDDEERLVVAAGSGLIDIDEQTSLILYNRLIDEVNSGKEAMLDSDFDMPFKYEWPANIKNIIAVPLCGKETTESHAAGKGMPGSSIIGLMVAINRVGKRDFDSTDIKLFNSVASGCAVFIENGRLFNDLKDLFIGSLKALTTSIDAKDTYTHGHSERVAFISRWIAERLSESEHVDDEQIHQIYLAGLLHDIGKIGIDEAVLRKTGRLTDEEYACIKSHPSVGAGILREIKQMREIMPGVLCHHERIDGRGYPSGLTGDQIPLTGKIVGLADSFDAMTSKRTYRDAMTVQQALAEIEKNLGIQFDEKIGRIFINSDVYRLWESIRDDYGEVFRDGTSAEYDAAAVETLIR
jgi:HD-GYP domain-containing protein (c-di-GMP phosphodiesterase class II)